MYKLYLKELGGFFQTLTGYIVIFVFLLSNSLFLWIFPGPMNILDNAYASLENLFFISPWIFLFLVPAISMRFFAEEKKQGTLELIITKPMTEFQIIFAKYLAGLSLVLFSLIPTLLYFLSVYWLGNPVGSIDVGGTWGSFIGLFLLAAIYTAVGIFSSACTDNQIIAFILAIIISFFFFTGFESAAGIGLPSGISNVLVQFGINEHYRSISRGLVDSRDLIYFISVSGAFLLLTRFVLKNRKW